MAVDYTREFRSREYGNLQNHHFGDERKLLDEILKDGAGSTFVGREEEYVFFTPNVDAQQPAVLMFQSVEVNHDKNELRINGSKIDSAIRRSGDYLSKDWQGNVVIIPSDRLQGDGQNTLKIDSLNKEGGEDGDLDDFIIDSIVLFYKTIEQAHDGQQLTVTATASVKR